MRSPRGKIDLKRIFPIIIQFGFKLTSGELKSPVPNHHAQTNQILALPPIFRLTNSFAPHNIGIRTENKIQHLSNNFKTLNLYKPFNRYYAESNQTHQEKPN